MHILFITRHYPPEVSGGARRPFLFVNALRKLGHKVTIVTPFELDDKHAITIFSPSIHRSMQTSVKAHRKNKHWETRLKASLRTLLYWPDPDILWARNVIKTISAMDIDADWVFTSNPPESMHLVGAHLTKSLNIPWIAEFRDTWIHNPHRMVLNRSRLRVFFERRIAQKALSHAHALTSVSSTVISEARQYVKAGTPECVIPHFSNEPNFNEANSSTLDRDKLNIVHTGAMTLSDHRRHLAPLLEALQIAYIQRPELVLHIAGSLTDEEVMLAKQSLVPVKLYGAISLQASRVLQTQADALLLYTPYDSHALPGKYAEYVMAKRPILYMGSGWLDLIDNPTTIQPMIEGIIALKKAEIVSGRGALTDKAAAKKLASFLISVSNTG